MYDTCMLAKQGIVRRTDDIAEFTLRLERVLHGLEGKKDIVHGIRCNIRAGLLNGTSHNNLPREIRSTAVKSRLSTLPLLSLARECKTLFMHVRMLLDILRRERAQAETRGRAWGYYAPAKGGGDCTTSTSSSSSPLALIIRFRMKNLRNFVCDLEILTSELEWFCMRYATDDEVRDPCLSPPRETTEERTETAAEEEAAAAAAVQREVRAKAIRELLRTEILPGCKSLRSKVGGAGYLDGVSQRCEGMRRSLQSWPLDLRAELGWVRREEGSC